MRFQAGRPVKLTHTFLEDDDPITPTSVTVTVVADGGTAPVASGAATSAQGVFTFSAGLLPEGVYTATFDGGAVAKDTVTFEVTGGVVFTNPELRGTDADWAATRYPAAKVRAAREATEVEFERITGRSFTPRTRRFTVQTDPDGSVFLPCMDVLSVSTQDGTGQTFNRYGYFAEVEGLQPCTVYTLTVRYGFTDVPQDVKTAAVTRAKYFLTEERSGVPDRATSFQPDQGGTYTLATAGRAGFETGIPDVDKVLKDYTPEIVQSVFGGVS